MSSSTIGIKIANGTYYPILEEGSTAKKKLILTTVNDSQRSVQIDLYKGSGKELADAFYIGSLVIENVEEAVKGEPDIELVVGLDKEGNLTASAGDEKTGEHQSLSVSLESLDEDGTYDLPDFEIGGDFQSDDIGADLDDFDGESAADEEDSDLLSDDDFGSDDFDDSLEDNEDLADFESSLAEDDSISDFDASEGVTQEEAERLRDESTEFHREEESAQPVRYRDRPVMRLLFILLGIVLIVLIVILLFRLFDGRDIPPLRAFRQDTQEQVQDEPPPPAADDQDQDASSNTVAQADTGKAAGNQDKPAAEQDQTNQQDQSSQSSGENQASGTQETTGAGEKLGGVNYRIRWGDTLWDLSSSFYMNPLLYPEIATENQIKNPDLIYAGNNLYIPELDN